MPTCGSLVFKKMRVSVVLFGTVCTPTPHQKRMNLNLAEWKLSVWDGSFFCFCAIFFKIIFLLTCTEKHRLNRHQLGAQLKFHLPLESSSLFLHNRVFFQTHKKWIGKCPFLAYSQTNQENSHLILLLEFYSV